MSFAINQTQKKALTGALVIALIGGAYFLRHYFSLIAFAAILAFMFNSTYHWFERRWKNPNKSSMVTLVIALLTLIIPLVLVMAISAQQINSLANNVDSASVNNFINEVLSGVNQILAKLGIHKTIDQGSVTASIEASLKQTGQNSVKSIPQFFSSFFSFFSTSIIFLFVFLSLLKNQKTIVKTAHSINPLGQEISQLYLAKIAAMTRAMVRGQFIIAVAQGFTDASLLAIAGLPQLFFFFFVLLTAFSIIPLGGGIVAIPIGIVMILTGNIWGGVLVVAGHIIIVTNIDNVLRPQLVPKQAKLDSALTLLSVFSGLKLFGFLGIVIGPVIMILIVTTIQVYQEVHGNTWPGDGAGNKAKGIFARTYNRVRHFGRKQAA